MKKYLPLALLIMSIIFALAFIGFTAYDIYIYNTTVNSAPLYVFILARAVEFIVPAVALYIVSRVLKKKLFKEGG